MSKFFSGYGNNWNILTYYRKINELSWSLICTVTILFLIFIVYPLSSDFYFLYDKCYSPNIDTVSIQQYYFLFQFLKLLILIKNNHWYFLLKLLYNNNWAFKSSLLLSDLSQISIRILLVDLSESPKFICLA